MTDMAKKTTKTTTTVDPKAPTTDNVSTDTPAKKDRKPSAQRVAGRKYGTGLTATPDGFDFDKARLSMRQFVTMAQWYAHQCDKYTARAAHYDALAKDPANDVKRQSSASKARATVKALSAKQDALVAALLAAGQTQADIDALLGNDNG